MGQYNKAVLTTAGEKLIARALVGEIKLNITKAKTSDFAYPDNADLKRLTDMQGIRQTVCDPETVVFNETTIQTRVLFSNEDIESTYYIHNIGLYAMDGTNEVLFSIVTAEMPDEMPQYNGVASTSYIYNIQNVVQDAPQLNISVNLSGTATIQDVLERVDAIGGDISETVIETLDTVEDKYPIPAAGESVKRFFGKVLTFLRNIRPLTGHINIYVSTTGSDITGDGGESNPYASIGKALGTITKDLGGYTAAINISDGTYNEDVVIKGISNGYIRLQRNGVQELNNLCNVKSIRVENCNSVSISGLNLTTIDASGIFGTRTDFINVQSCQSISNANTQPSFNFDYVSVVRVAGNRSLNHYSCLRSYFSEVSSEKWSSDSVGIQCGIDVSSGGKITKCDVYQPRGNVIDTYYAAGVIVSSFGAKIGSLSTSVNLYVATTGSDTTGDGTSAKPFKTIQHAIDILPNDLDTHSAMITVASGIYNEDIEFSGFTGGLLQLTLSGNVTIGSLLVRDSRIVCAATSTCTLTIKSLYVTEFGRFDSFSNIGITTTGYVNDQPLNGNKASIAVNRGDVYISGPITLTGNIDVGVSVISVSRMYFSTISGSGLSIGIFVSTGSVVYIGGSNNISATTKVSPGAGGMVINPNGTQISELTTTGLTCTWGTVGGRYYKIGNAGGISQVVVNISVTLTTALTAHQAYSIGGFPFAGAATAVTTHLPSYFDHAQLYSNGMHITPAINLPVAGTYLFSCTYIADDRWT